MIEDVEEDISSLESEGGNMSLLASDNISLHCGLDITNASVRIVQDLHFWCGGVATALTGSLGILGNIVSVIILCKRSLSSVFHHLLAALCTADLLFLLSQVLVSPMALGYSDIYPSLVYHSSECVCHLALAASVFLTIAITIERYQAVTSPHMSQSRHVATGHRTLLAHYIVPAVMMAALLNIPRFLSVSPLGPKLQGHPDYLRFLIVYQSLHPLTTTGIAPLLILTGLNFTMFRMYRIIQYSMSSYGRSQSGKRELHLARMMALIVITFLVLNMPRVVVGVFEFSRYNVMVACYSGSVGHYVAPSWQLQLDILARYLAVLNSSLNFLLYCMGGRQFRVALNGLFTLPINNCQAEVESGHLTADTRLQPTPEPKRELEVDNMTVITRASPADVLESHL